MEADFSQADLQETIFHHSDLSKANMISAINYFINPIDNSLKKAKVSFPECIGILKALDITIVE